MSYLNIDITTFVGYILFFVSEILPLLHIPTNGILHTFVLGISNAFKVRTRDVQLARDVVKDSNFANVVNTLSNNPTIKKVIDDVLANPQLALALTSNNGVSKSVLLNQVNNLNSNPQLQNIMDYLTKNPQLQNNMASLLNNGQGLNVIQQLTSSPQLLSPLNTLVSLQNNQDVITLLNRVATRPELLASVNEILNQGFPPGQTGPAELSAH
jgi:hypothetical protein